MAKILADREIRQLIGTVLIGAEEKYINPNGIELRLGKHVRFHSTEEEMELEPSCFLKVGPGESVTIASVELIDFRAQTVQTIFPECMLMGFITPTTTMMREGISLVSTKIDAGFRGILNWGLRNGSTKNLILQHGEPIFKLTIFRLEADETPETPYGSRSKDSYQDAEGIVRSARQVPADIPKSKIVCSSFDRIDPKKQLREAGYPFDHIGTELTTLDGKFEIVSADVRLMKDEFQKRTQEVTEKILVETKTLSTKIEENRKSLLDTVESLFDRKFFRVVGIIVGAIPVMYGGAKFLQGTSLGERPIAFMSTVAGIAVVLVSYALTRRGK